MQSKEIKLPKIETPQILEEETENEIAVEKTTPKKVEKKAPIKPTKTVAKKAKIQAPKKEKDKKKK